MRTRTRTVNAYKAIPFSRRKANGYPVLCGSFSVSNGVLNKIVKVTTDTMTDEEPINGALRPERSCFHVKDVKALGDNRIRWTVNSNNEIYDTTSDYYRSLPASVGLPTSQAWVLPDLKADLLENEDPLQVAWQSMPFLGELKSTVSMIRNPLSFLSKLRVPKGMHQLPLGRVLDRLGLGQASNAWLQYQYGWAPLMGDLSRIATGCATMHEQYQAYKAGSGTVRRRKLSVQGPSSDTTLSSSAQGFTRRTSTQSAKVNLTYRIKPARETGEILSYPAFLAQKLGVTPRGLAQTAWELTPYSFVVDWFLPVGKFLNGQRYSPCHFSIQRYSYHHTITLRSERLWRFSYAQLPVCNVYSYPFQTTGDAMITDYYREATSYYRNWEGHFPLGENASNGLTTKRTISALSLIAQRLMCPLRG